MPVSRRAFVKASLGASGLALLGPVGTAHAALTRGAPWKQYQVTTEIQIDTGGKPVQVWVPLPLIEDTDYFRTISIRPEAQGAELDITKSRTSMAPMMYASWAGNPDKPKLKLTYTVRTRDRVSPLNEPANPSIRLSDEDIRFWTRGTDLLPVNGIVKTRSDEIMAKVPADASDVARAKAVYDWVIENTFRDPDTKGCGVGDVKTMLETGNLGGKCADLNALFVALARSAGVPARDVYGIRVDDSARGYKSLGKSGDISKAQHCRAEFFAQGYGWVAVDPADVRKVILEEGGGLPANDPKVVAIRDYLFGNWEMNWMPYNYDHDIVLPGSTLGIAGKIGYLMYPEGEVGRLRLDALDPANFQYRITSVKTL